MASLLPIGVLLLLVVIGRVRSLTDQWTPAGSNDSVVPDEVLHQELDVAESVEEKEAWTRTCGETLTRY